MINTNYEPLPTIPFAAAQQGADLIRGLFLERLLLTLDCVVNIAAGGGGATTAITDGVARLIRQLVIRWENFELVRLSGRDILLLTRAAAQAQITGATPGSIAIGSETLQLQLMIPFARPWLRDPFDTVLPPLPVQNQFRVYVDWEQGVTSAGDDPGTAALFTGGTRVITFTTPPTLTITQVAAQRGREPWYIPVYTSYDSEQFLAANARLIYNLTQNRRFDMAVISARQGPLAVDADLINTLTLASGGQRHINTLRVGDLRAQMRQEFPAFATDLNLVVRTAGGGLLGNVAEPTAMVSPRLELDVAVPGANPGLIHLVMSELLTHSALTKVKGAG